MTLDPGIAAATLAASGVIIAAIVKFAPNRGNGGGSFVSKELFEERTGSISRSLARIETKLDEHTKRLDSHIARSEET